MITITYTMTLNIIYTVTCTTNHYDDENLSTGVND